MKTVLLLGDDNDVRALLKTVLVSRGLEVFEASVADADAALRRVSADVIVIDDHASDAAEFTLIERLRRCGAAGTRIVLLAEGRDFSTLKRVTSEVGVALVLYKPIEPSAVAAKVVDLLGEGAGASTVVDELAELRRQFAASLPGKLSLLEDVLRQAKLDVSRMGEARTLSHRLRGSAGSFGYAAVGEAVGQVEDLIVAAQQPDVASGGAVTERFFWERVDGAMREARLAVSRAPESVDRGAGAPRASMKALLVVDDDPEFLQMVRRTGRKLFVDVVTAQSSDEALQRAEAQPLIAAILDIQLHEDDVFVLARKIRETAGNAETAIAFVSADRRMEARVAAIEAGGTKFFEKPTSEEVFAEGVQQFLRLSQSQQGRVLIVDDDSDVLAHYSRHLRAAGFFVEQLPCAEALVDKLDAMRPDVLLLDVNLPNVSGIDVCRALRVSERWELLPILMVTAQTDSATRLRAFRAGASDVIAKPVLPEELLARVGVQAERMRLLRDRADKDALSGLLLRRAFLEAFQRALAGCVRDERPLSLVLLDLDHFKAVNDTYGHLAGDQVIARLGELLRRRFRVEDLRARWGGEEFVLVFPGQGVEFAAQAARRVLSEFAELRFSADDRQSFSVTFTAGVSAYPEDGASSAALLRRADELLYVGKREGRNRVTSSVASAAGEGAR